MKSIYSILRAALLVIIAVISLAFSLTINEMGFFFGISLLIGAALSGIYLFIHFDENINEKVIMEPLVDAFAGLVILTHPEVSTRFILTDFSFWMAMHGILYIAAGFFNHQKTSYLWLYVLTGLVAIIFGFTIVNYNDAFLSSVTYLMAFSLIIYGMISIYLSIIRQNAPLQPLK
jgi:uncharacterized membrane protein HdeD (DUF308 family)